MSNDTDIAILAKYFLGWGGGTDFLRNCVGALLVKGKDHAIRVNILVPDKSPRGEIIDFLFLFKKLINDLASFRKPQYRRIKPIAKEILIDELDIENNDLAIVNYRDNQNGLVSCLEKLGTVAIFPMVESPGESFPFPWVGYIPDLQHKVLPSLFSISERTERDRIFSGLLRDARAVIVNSRSVKSDIERYYTDSRCRIFSLPFSPVPHRSWFELDPTEYRMKYNLPDRYFIISNQFWIHKSHITAFEALYKLREIHPASNVHIVCTGEIRDYRFPNYFEELKTKIDEMNLSQYIHFLGYIPKKDQLQILRGAIALLQPTLFEGGPGGGAVYDAVSLGVPSIVSDIPVNKEILGGNVFFFHTGSSDAMKEKMLELLEEEIEKPPKEILIEQGIQRAEMLGKSLCEAFDFVISLASDSSNLKY